MTTKEKSFFIYSFWYIGNGGYAAENKEYRIYASDPAYHGKEYMDDITDQVLGGNYPSSVRSLHWEAVENPSTGLLETILKDVMTNIRSLENAVENKRKIALSLITYLNKG
jgi:hypothetical protein